MRTTISLLCLVFMLCVVHPAEAQLRNDGQSGVQTQLYEAGSSVAGVLDHLFDSEHFQMAHSYEMSFSSFGGSSSSLGMYTNTVMWQPSESLAARVDVAVAHSPFGNSALGQQQDAQVFLRNAQVAYKPMDNMEIRFNMRQSPHGSYMSPYGSRGLHSGGFGMRTGQHDLFWRN